MIVDRTGGVLTNYHVVAGADSVVVRLSDGREFPAEEVRGDPWSDLAVLRVRDAGELPEARLAGRARVGDWVIAAGNSFGLGLSVDPGTVRPRRRRLRRPTSCCCRRTPLPTPGTRAACS